jgi:hypothetical protein
MMRTPPPTHSDLDHLLGVESGEPQLAALTGGHKPDERLAGNHQDPTTISRIE